MIKTFEELGEVLAEFENRLSYLENALPVYQGERNQQSGTAVTDSLDDRRWQRVQQLRAQVLHLSKQIVSKEIKGLKRAVNNREDITDRVRL